MIQITVEGRRAAVPNKELLTSGSAGIEAQFTFDSAWEGIYAKRAVFRVGDDGEKIDIALDNSLTCVIPPEMLATADEVLFVGVYGADQDGYVIIPTIWTSLGVVKPGVDPANPREYQPTPSIVDQIHIIANRAEQTATDAMTLVEEGLSDLSTLESTVQGNEEQRQQNETQREADFNTMMQSARAYVLEPSVSAIVYDPNADSGEKISPAYLSINAYYIDNEGDRGGFVVPNFEVNIIPESGTPATMSWTNTTGVSLELPQTITPGTTVQARIWKNNSLGLPMTLAEITIPVVANGEHSTTYILQPDYNVVEYDPNAVAGSRFSPSSFSVYAYKVTGHGERERTTALFLSFSIGNRGGTALPGAAGLVVDLDEQYDTPDQHIIVRGRNGNLVVAQIEIPIVSNGLKGDPFTYADFTEEQKADLVQGPILDAQTSAVAAVNQAGTNQVAAVNSAGATQTAAAAEQARLAGVSATNASNSAAAATTAKNDAVTAKDAAVAAKNAAETAETNAETAQTAAEDAAASVSASAAQIAQNTSDISDLTRQLSDVESEIGSPIYDMTEVSLTTISGYAVTGTVGQTVSIAQSTYWKYAKFGCKGGDNFIVNTYMASNTAVTGYVYFTDTNDKILSVQVTPTGTQQYSGNTIVTAPTGSAYIYLKGYIYGNTASHAYDYTIRPLSNEIQNNTKWLVGYEFFLSPNGISFSGNGSQDTPLIVDFNGRLYYRNLGSTGDLTHSITTSSAFSIAHGQALVFDLSTNTLSVVNNANGVLGSNYRILLKKHVTTIGGFFAYEYYIATMGVATGFSTKYKNVTIMSRQGEFLLNGTQNAAPYNCRIGIKNTSQNGYSAIRISVRPTFDHVWVLSHNGTINSVARNSDGTEITDPVYVADSTLAELNQYDYGIKYGTSYAGEDITTLDEALLLARKLSLYTCIEIYPTTNIDDSDIASLCKSVIDSGSVKSTEFRSPNVTTLQSIKTIIDGANFDLTFYASDGDSGVQNKITALKALSNGRNTIRMTTIPDTISNSSFQTSIQRIIKEGIELELASTYGYTQLKTAIESGYCNIIESTNVINPYVRLNVDFV